MSSPSAVNPLTTTSSVFRISPLIWLSLWVFYLALTLPLPVLAWINEAEIAIVGLSIGIGVGGLALHAALSERVQVDPTGIKVYYPRWVSRFFRQGWSLNWSDIQELKIRSTGQGGRVYYLQTAAGTAYLLPMRIVGFAQMMRVIQAQTGLDTTQVKPLAQPWMYAMLFGCALLLLLADGWIIWTGLIQLASVN